MLIRELEKDTGLERATIRFYEKEGFITPHREENGYRTYSEGDRDTLLKIKLLRQLGMSLDMIRGLQRGSEDFQTVLNDQINALEHKIQDAGRAKEVCVELRDTGAAYENLDAAHYLHELTRVRPAEPAWKPQTVPEFHQRPLTHPWRRYFARTIDYMLLNLLEMFVMVVVLRIRPLSSSVYTLFGFAITSYLLWIPIEGLLLHYWGTTPGKWIMGIRVESANGGNLSISAAMHRAWGILRHGYGFTVPVYEWWRQYRSHMEYAESGYTQWDSECDAELQFSYYYKTAKKVIIAVIAVSYLLVTGWVLCDGVKPVYRGDDLTVAQIARNHNDYLVSQYDDRAVPASYRLTEDGLWDAEIPVGGNGGAVVVIGSTAVDGNPNYQYEIENGFVRKIKYSRSWEDIFYLMPVGTRVQYTILSVAAAQEWSDIFRLNDFSNALAEALRAQNGEFHYENLVIRWTAETQNCIISTDGVYYAEDAESPSSLKFSFELIIHDSD